MGDPAIDNPDMPTHLASQQRQAGYTQLSASSRQRCQAAATEQQEGRDVAVRQAAVVADIKVRDMRQECERPKELRCLCVCGKPRDNRSI